MLRVLAVVAAGSRETFGANPRDGLYEMQTCRLTFVTNRETHLSRRRWLTVALSVPALLLSSLGWSTPAQAYTCSTSSSCIGGMIWTKGGPNSGFRGVGADIRSNCLTISDPSRQFINNEVWLIGGGSPPYEIWLEAGVTRGVNTQVGNVATSPMNFWAKRTSTDYMERTSSAGYTLGTYNTVRIAGDGADNWRITSSAGMNANTSGVGFYHTDTVQGGLESADTNGRSTGSQQRLQYMSLTGSWVDGWESGTSHADPRIGQVLQATWAQRYVWAQNQQGAAC